MLGIVAAGECFISEFQLFFHWSNSSAMSSEAPSEREATLVNQIGQLKRERILLSIDVWSSPPKSGKAQLVQTGFAPRVQDAILKINAMF